MTKYNYCEYKINNIIKWSTIGMDTQQHLAIIAVTLNEAL